MGDKKVDNVKLQIAMKICLSTDLIWLGRLEYYHMRGDVFIGPLNTMFWVIFIREENGSTMILH
jgi:hypothetical protein